MIGHEGVIRSVARLLRDHGADTARLIEQHRGLEPGTIVTPAAENIHTAWTNVAKGEFPSWMVLPADTPARRTASYSEDQSVADITEWQYPIMVAHHVAAENQYQCQLHRSRLLLVVRTLLIRAKKIYDSGDGQRLVVYLDEMQELVGGQEQNQQTQKHLMEAFTAFHVTSLEKTPAAQTPLGVVGGISDLADVRMMGDTGSQP